jgi:ABC-2 type transport system permease protein
MLLLVIAAGYLHKIRKVETAGDILSFPILRPVFRYGVIFCLMLLAGALMAEMSDGNFAAMSFGYLVSSFLGYWISEMLMQKSFKVWRAYKEYVVLTLLLIAVLIGFKTDISGFVHRVPEPDQVQSAFFGDTYRLANLENKNEGDKLSVTDKGNLLTGSDNINNIIQLHKELMREPFDKSGASMYIIYKLKNGKQISRRYYVNIDKYSAILKSLYESMEYKRSVYPIFTQKPESISGIYLHIVKKTDNLAAVPEEIFTITSKKRIAELTDLLRKEVERLDYERMVYTARIPESIRVQIVSHGKHTFFDLNGKNPVILQWLKDKGYYE